MMQADIANQEAKPRRTRPALDPNAANPREPFVAVPIKEGDTSMSNRVIPMSTDTIESLERVLSWHLDAGTPSFMEPDEEDTKRTRDFMVMLRTAIRESIPLQEGE